MKPLPLLLAASLTVAFFGASVNAHAQFPVVKKHQQHKPKSGAVVPASPQALAALQTDLINSIQAMTSALPIYDGYRVRAIHATHRALVIVDKALSGANAMIRPKPTVKDHIKSTAAKSKYTAQQISASQTEIQQGIQALRQAQVDLKAAAGSKPNKHAYTIAGELSKALTDANYALSIHNGGLGATSGASAPAVPSTPIPSGTGTGTPPPIP